MTEDRWSPHLLSELAQGLRAQRINELRAKLAVRHDPSEAAELARLMTICTTDYRHEDELSGIPGELTDDAREAIRSSNESAPKLSRRYGCSISTVWRIRNKGQKSRKRVLLAEQADVARVDLG